MLHDNTLRLVLDELLHSISVRYIELRSMPITEADQYVDECEQIMRAAVELKEYLGEISPFSDSVFNTPGFGPGMFERLLTKITKCSILHT